MLVRYSSALSRSCHFPRFLKPLPICKSLSSSSKATRTSRRRSAPRKKTQVDVDKLDPETLKQLNIENFKRKVRRLQRRQKNGLDIVYELARKRREEVANLVPRQRFSSELKRIIDILEDAKCFDIKVYHTQRRLQSCDLMVVGSAYSGRQAFFSVSKVGELAAELGFLGDNPKRAKAVSIEDGWIYSDCRDVMVYVLTDEIRQSAEWEIHFRHEEIPEKLWHDPMKFSPKLLPEPDVAWFDEVDDDHNEAEQTGNR